MYARITFFSSISIEFILDCNISERNFSERTLAHKITQSNHKSLKYEVMTNLGLIPFEIKKLA